MLLEYEKHAISLDKTDGISLTFDDWRFNLRKSDTEPTLGLMPKLAVQLKNSN